MLNETEIEDYFDIEDKIKVEDKLKITVLDAIMGSGKSTGMISHINLLKRKDPNKKFLVILPYLKEIERYATYLIGFKKLVKNNPPKSITLEKYLKEEQDIICTHTLFLQNPNLITKYAKGYTLIIDEAINSLITPFKFPDLINSERINTDININLESESKLSLKPNTKTYTFSDNDISFMFEHKYLSLSGKHEHLLLWNEDNNKNSIYNSLKECFTLNDVYRLEAKHELEANSYYYISLFPINTFKTFENIYIMTFLWQGQLMKYYFDFYGAEYSYEYPIKGTHYDPNPNIAPTTAYPVLKNPRLYSQIESILKRQAINHITIPGYKLEGNKFIKNPDSRTTLYKFWNKNKHAKNTIALSYNFYYNLNDNNKQILALLKSNINKFVKDNVPKEVIPNKKVIWSVFDCAKDELQTNCKYINDNNYVPVNAKATNEYRSANTLIYLVNRFINPHLYNFINNYCPTGYNFNEDIYSLSELIQWIWRSAIRDNNHICIYIPSERMLNIFINWLNNDIELN